MITQVIHKEDRAFVLGSKGVLNIEFDDEDIILITVENEEGEISNLCFPLTSIEYYTTTEDTQ